MKSFTEFINENLNYGDEKFLKFFDQVLDFKFFYNYSKPNNISLFKEFAGKYPGELFKKRKYHLYRYIGIEPDNMPKKDYEDFMKELRTGYIKKKELHQDISWTQDLSWCRGGYYDAATVGVVLEIIPSIKEIIIDISDDWIEQFQEKIPEAWMESRLSKIKKSDLYGYDEEKEVLLWLPINTKIKVYAYDILGDNGEFIENKIF